MKKKIDVLKLEKSVSSMEFQATSRSNSAQQFMLRAGSHSHDPGILSQEVN